MLPTVAEPVKAKFPEISYADLYTYAGVVAVEEAGGLVADLGEGEVDARPVRIGGEDVRAHALRHAAGCHPVARGAVAGRGVAVDARCPVPGNQTAAR